LRPHPRDEFIAQRLLAAKEMPAPCNVEKQAVRRVDDDNRREALAPCRDRIQRARIFGWFGFDSMQCWIDRARIGKRLAHLQAQRCRARIDAAQYVGVFLLSIDSQRRIRRAPGTDQPIRRQARQMQRQPHVL
jgi:hypothetical protein